MGHLVFMDLAPVPLECLRRTSGDDSSNRWRLHHSSHDSDPTTCPTDVMPGAYASRTATEIKAGSVRIPGLSVRLPF